MPFTDPNRVTDLRPPMNTSLHTVDYADQLSLRGYQAWYDKFRFQLPFILLCSALLQAIVGVAINPAGPGQSFFTNSLIFGVAANLPALLHYRGLRLFPGARRFAYVIPTFAVPYSVGFVVIAAIRPSYSIPMIITGGLSAIFLLWLLNVGRTRNARSAPMLLVPTRKTLALQSEIPGLHCRLVGSPDELLDGRQTIIVDLVHDHAHEWQRALAQAVLQGSTVYHVKQIRESLTGRVQIDHLRENSSGALTPNALYFFAKDVGDRIAALVLLVLAAPLIALGALAILFESKGSPFFHQERVGFRGRIFTIHKLRTMRTDLPSRGALEDSITLPDDPRISPVGKFLRRTRIDELPQLWNILVGDMSLIGPRPEALELSRWYERELDFYSYRHIVKPGISGWAQVMQGHVAGTDDVFLKTQYDFYYIKNFSLWLDILIGLKTLGVVFSGAGHK